VEDYKDQGLKILTFPCNQFGGQEPGSNEEILKFAKENYPSSDQFLFFSKGDVNGPDTLDTFAYLKSQLPTDGTNNPIFDFGRSIVGLQNSDVPWNFAKFLVDHEGKAYKRYAPTSSPLSLKSDIDTLLKKRNKP